MEFHIENLNNGGDTATFLWVIEYMYIQFSRDWLKVIMIILYGILAIAVEIYFDRASGDWLNVIVY